MSDIVITPASPNFEKLKGKLRELFELDKADLDFGIYRILRQRHREIAEFLDRHLESTVRAALASHGNVQSQQLKQELESAETAARAAGFEPDQSPKVKELRAKLAEGTDVDSAADEVYSHLLTFFARYYREGDFLGLHRSTVQGREKYMIPYNGEEVKLVWANMDQYYIKSSELLRDYTFRIRRSDLTDTLSFDFGDQPDEVVIHFKLVEGDTEKDNRKPDGKTARAFALDEGNLFEEADDQTLYIRFRYREHTTERDLQKKVNEDTEKTLYDNLPPRWRALLFASDSTYSGKDKKDKRTVLQKHLRSYTARYQFDYFIHKDLGEFLKRELDFYIKNEVVHLDDLAPDNAEVTAEQAMRKAQESLSKVVALRRCALPVIRMLEQLENFQKKLWLKKKFVVETRYCVTLDRVPEELYEEICANDAQWVEWERLYAISEIESDLFSPKAKKRTIEFLKANPFLMIDTQHFNREFTLRLLASVEDLDEALDGVCFSSENFQALQLMQERYREQVKCIYIDPPYNTDASPIMYKNGFKDSTYASLILDRVQISRGLLKREGALCAAIDDVEITILREMLELVFGVENRQGVAPVRSNPSGRSTPTGFSIAHDYAIFYSNSSDSQVGRLKRTEKQLSRYGEEDAKSRFEWVNFRKHGGAEARRAARPKMYYPFYVTGDLLRIPELEWSEPEQKWIVLENPDANENVVWPINERGQELRWKWGVERTREFLSDFRVGTEQMGRTGIYFKSRMETDGTLPLTWWDRKEYSATEYGTNL